MKLTCKTKKKGKLDSFLNEMVKHGQYFLLPSLEKIFHDILKVNFRLTGILAGWNPFTKRKVIEGGPQKITAEESIFWQVVWANCSHQFNNPVLFSLLIFINDWPQYFRAHNCPGVKLGNHSLNCLMYVCWWSVSN